MRARIFGALAFASAGGARTDVAYVLRSAARRLWGARLVLLLGAIAIIAGHLLIRSLAIPSPDASVRAQTWQMVQVVHFLWPPFLLAAMPRVQLRAGRNHLRTLIENLRTCRTEARHAAAGRSAPISRRSKKS